MLLAILLRHPFLLPDVEEALGGLDLSAGHASLRDGIVQWGTASAALDSGALITHLTQIGLATQVAQALSAVPAPLPACASADAMPAEAASGWWHFFGLMNPDRLEDEVATASRAFETHADETSERRLKALCAARNALRSGSSGWDETET
jgi:DNA primase